MTSPIKLKSFVKFPATITASSPLVLTKTSGSYAFSVDMTALSASITILPSDALPLINGTAAAGTSTAYAREGHVHPKDTTKANSGANSDITSLTALSTPLSVAQGGTAYAGGAWTSFTCTAVPGAGSITTQASDSTYLQIGKIVFVMAKVTITAVGTGSGTVTVNLPVAAKRASVLAGRESGSSGKALCIVATAASTSAPVFNYDNTNPTLNSSTIYVFSGCYEAS